MVVNDFDVLRSGISSGEADPPLPIDPNAVLIGPISPQLLKTVSRRHPKVGQDLGCIENEQFAKRGALRPLVQFSTSFSLPDSLGVLVSEGPQHSSCMTCHVMNVNLLRGSAVDGVPRVAVRTSEEVGDQAMQPVQQRDAPQGLIRSDRSAYGQHL